METDTEQPSIFSLLTRAVPGAGSKARPCKTEGCPNLTEEIELEPAVLAADGTIATPAVTASLSNWCERCVERIREREAHAEAEKEAARMKANRAAWWSKIWGGPESQYHKTSISRLPDPAAASKVLRWHLDLDKGVLLHGDTGSGKTRTVYLLLRDILMTKGVYPRIEKCAMLRSKIIKAAMDSEEARQALLRELVEARLLYLDDLGQMAKSDPCEEFLFNVVEERTNLGRPIIATTQFTGDTFAKLFSNVKRGEAIGRRLAENSFKIAFTKPNRPANSNTDDDIP